MRKILFVTDDVVLTVDILNNLGYYNLRLKNYQQSIAYFEDAIQRIPDYGFACDNWGYIHIQLGNLQEGKKWLDKALQTKNNHIRYSYRNLALYYQAHGDFHLAEDFFKKALDSISDSVDLLEYHYADYLIQQGRNDEGMAYLKKAVDKGEPEAIHKINEIIKSGIW